MLLKKCEVYVRVASKMLAMNASSYIDALVYLSP